MKFSFVCLAISSALITASVAFAQAPAAAPAGSTGMCKDGSYTNHDTKKGACSGHKGVKEWYATAAAPATTAAPAAAPAPAPAAAPSNGAPAPATKPVANAPAAGGGPGQVWVNAATKVYHCPGTKYYGTTKQGEYMTESAAKAAGARADHGKACS